MEMRLRVKDIKKDHPLIYRRIEEVCEEQGKVFDKHCYISYLIDGTLTTERYGVWKAIQNGVFAPFYEFYDEKNKESTEYIQNEK